MSITNSAPVVIYEMRTDEKTPGQLVPLMPNREDTVNIESAKDQIAPTQAYTLFSYPGHRIVDVIKAIKQAWQL